MTDTIFLHVVPDQRNVIEYWRSTEQFHYKGSERSRSHNVHSSEAASRVIHGSEAASLAILRCIYNTVGVS